MSSVFVPAGDVAALLVNDSSLIYEWQYFFHNLQLGIGSLHGLELKYNQSPNTFSLLFSIIRLWVAEQGEQATIRKLADALDATRHGDARDVLLHKFNETSRVTFNGTVVPVSSSSHQKTATEIADVFYYDSSQGSPETEQYENADLKEKTIPGGITIMEIMPHRPPGERVLLVLTHLLKILSEVGPRPVTIVSINGKQRAGKSFLANQFVKYLSFKDTLGEEWLSGQLGKTFPWRDSTERVTSGIQVWHKPLPSFHNNNGVETAVIILDTQGLFDNKTTTSENSIIFGFSLLLSSVFIFNEKHNGDDSLQNLHSFMEVTKFASGTTGGGSEADSRTQQVTSAQLKFQKLILLLRDWEVEEEHDFGYYDDTSCPPGEDRNLKHRILGVNNNNHMSTEARNTRMGIREGFEEIAVYAMCPPGRKLPGKAVYRESSKWNKGFRNSVIDFVTTVLSPEYLHDSHKRVCGEEVSGEELKDYVVSWGQLIHNAGGILEPKSVWDKTVELFYSKRVDACVAEYGDKMLSYLSAHSPQGMPEPTLANYHDSLMAELCSSRLGCNLLGGEVHVEKAMERVLQKVDILKKGFFETNRANIAAELERKQGAETKLELSRVRTAAEVQERQGEEYQRELHLNQVLDQAVSDYNAAMTTFVVQYNPSGTGSSDLDARHYELALELDKRLCGDRRYGTDSTSSGYKALLQQKLQADKGLYANINRANSEIEAERRTRANEKSQADGAQQQLREEHNRLADLAISRAQRLVNKQQDLINLEKVGLAMQSRLGFGAPKQAIPAYMHQDLAFYQWELDELKNLKK